MPIIAKTLQELNDQTAQRLVQIGYTDAQFKGTGVRSILESINLTLADLYSAVANNLQTAFVSKATTTDLDTLGTLLNCSRRAGENDINYRFRITQALQIASTGNLPTLLQALFAIANIRDVVVRPFTHGVGTISFYLIGVQGIVDATTQDLARAQLSQLSAAGAYTIITTPTPVLVNIQGVLGLASSSNAPALQATAQGALVNYLSNLTMGAPVIRAALDQVVLDAGGGQIADFQLQTLSTTDTAGITRQQLLGNLTPQFDEQFQSGTITIL